MTCSSSLPLPFSPVGSAIPNPKRVIVPECHVGLALLKRACQADLRAVQGHALAFVHADRPRQAQGQLRARRHHARARRDRPALPPQRHLLPLRMQRTTADTA